MGNVYIADEHKGANMIEVKDNTPEIEKILDRMAIALKELTDQLGCDFGVISISPESYVAGFDWFLPNSVESQEKLKFMKKWGDVNV